MGRDWDKARFLWVVVGDAKTYRWRRDESLKFNIYGRMDLSLDLVDSLTC